MESRAKLLGHPIHQMLIVFPLGLLGTSVVFDVVYMVRNEGRWAEISFWMICAGVLSGLVAAVFGAIDWAAIPNRTRAKRIGLMHGAANILAVTLFAVSWGLRFTEPTSPGTAAIVMSFIALGLALLGGWLGGELVDRLGVGIDDGAHLNAPNSLSGRPAASEAPGTARL